MKRNIIRILKCSSNKSLINTRTKIDLDISLALTHNKLDELEELWEVNINQETLELQILSKQCQKGRFNVEEDYF